MIVIICAEYNKNPSRTIDAKERTRFSKSRPSDLEDIGQGQRSSHAIHPFMLLIICTKYGKNPSWTVDATGRTRKVNRQTDGQTDRVFLTHLILVPHMCVSERVGIGSDNGLSPVRCQAIIWTTTGLLSIRPLRTNFSKILIKIQTFSFTTMHLKISSAKWRPFCPGDELIFKNRI